MMSDNALSEYADESKSRKFYTLMTHMLSVNESMNLTAIKEERAVILRHFVDSLTILSFLPKGARVADIGCGAGFPCLPIAICRPDLQILAVDSTEKRIRYVQETAELLGLRNLEARAMRAEEGAHGKYREAFDVCTARAVAALPILSELCMPYVRTGGKFIAMKAKKGEEEYTASLSGIRRLGGEPIAVHRILLRGEGEEDERLIIEVAKKSPTPGNLPRPYAKICKKPL